jgi:hypothetical protein
METSIFALLTLILCVGETIAQDAGSQSQPRRLTYEEVLQRWDRSRAYGDPRDLRTFSQDMVTRLQTGDETDDFSQGLRDGPWIRFYARSEQIFSGATGLVTIGALIAILFAVLFLPSRFLFPPFRRVLAMSGNELGGHPIHEGSPVNAAMTDSTPLPPKPKKKILPIILFAVGLAIMMAVFKECQHEQLTHQQAQRANTVVTVWMPAGPDGRLIPYSDVEILDKGSDYVRFRTQDGQVME